MDRGDLLCAGGRHPGTGISFATLLPDNPAVVIHRIRVAGTA
jgi:hypothetical protein